MDPRYHISLVENSSTLHKRTAGDDVLAKKAIRLYSSVIPAMEEVVSTGNYKKYIKSISNYDRFVWTESHKPDMSNLFAYKKIKVSPSWTEQLWAPVFERIRLQIARKWDVPLVLIQNKEVVETMNTDGPTAFKDVDGGVGIVKEFNGKACIMPIVVAEMKTGHFCKTACTGVDGIMRRVLTMNNKVLGFCVTDNNVTISRDAEVENVYGSGAALIQQRGIGFNKQRLDYPELDYKQLELVERICMNYLVSKAASDFLKVKLKPSSGVYLRESIDKSGHYIPPHLLEYR